jgi:hypothetical protein
VLACRSGTTPLQSFAAIRVTRRAAPCQWPKLGCSSSAYCATLELPHEGLRRRSNEAWRGAHWLPQGSSQVRPMGRRPSPRPETAGTGADGDFGLLLSHTVRGDSWKRPKAMPLSRSAQTQTDKSLRLTGRLKLERNGPALECWRSAKATPAIPCAAPGPK